MYRSGDLVLIKTDQLYQYNFLKEKDFKYAIILESLKSFLNIEDSEESLFRDPEDKEKELKSLFDTMYTAYCDSMVIYIDEKDIVEVIK